MAYTVVIFEFCIIFAIALRTLEYMNEWMYSWIAWYKIDLKIDW